MRRSRWEATRSYLGIPRQVHREQAQRVMENLTRFVEVRLKLVVNQAKSKATPLKQCAFLGFQIGAVGKAVWTIKAHARFKRRVREITRRNRGHRVQDISADEYPVKIQKTAIVDRRPLPDACQAIKCAAAAKKQ